MAREADTVTWVSEKEWNCPTQHKLIVCLEFLYYPRKYVDLILQT